MRKPLAIGATLIVALTAPGAATARERAHEFAVGSAKTELTINIVRDNGVEHAAFSAQNTSKAAPDCKAKGQIVYKAPATEFTAKIDELVIVKRLGTLLDPAGVFVGNGAYFRGVVTKATRGLFPVGSHVYFNVFDSAVMSGGTADEFLFEGGTAPTTPPTPPFSCLAPVLGHPITKGNIVIKTAS
jgi:hypothetical protein